MCTCVWNAAADGTCVRHHRSRCDLIEVAAPEWLPLAACSNDPDVSCMSADPRAPGRPRTTAVALASHTSRGSSSLSHAHSRIGRGHALRLVQLAARQLTAVAQPLQGLLASARSCMPLRMRSITTGVSHLQSRSFLGPPSAYGSVRCRWLRRWIRGALHFFACPVLAGRLGSEG